MPRDGVTGPLLEQPDEPVQPLEDAEDGPDTPDHHPVGEGVLGESEVAIPDEDRDGGVSERNGSRQGEQESPSLVPETASKESATRPRRAVHEHSQRWAILRRLGDRCWSCTLVLPPETGTQVAHMCRYVRVMRVG